MPDGPLGRIALDVYRKRPNILYALDRRSGAAGGPGRRRGGGAPVTKGRRRRRRRRRGGGGRGAAQASTPQPTGLYRSDDGGATWRKVNNANPRPMYFSQVRIDPNDPDVVYLRRRRPAPDARRRQDRSRTDVAAADPRRRARDLDRSGELRITCIIGNDGGLAVSLRPGEDVELLPEPAGRALLPRELRHGDAVQHLRRHAGQLQLVRPERGARRRRHRQPSTGRRSRAATASSCSRIRPTTASSTASRRTATWSASIASPARRCRSGRRPAPGEPPLRWHWDTPLVHLAARSEGRLRRGATRCSARPIAACRGTAISPDLTTNAEPRRRSSRWA